MLFGIEDSIRKTQRPVRALCAPLPRIVLLTAAIALLSNVDTHSAHACVCSERPSPAEEFQRSRRVFSGKVVETYVLDKPEGDEFRYMMDRRTIVYKIGVTRVWKGRLNETAYVFGRAVGSSCAMTLDEGPEYLIYGALSACGRLGHVPDAKEDLAFLGPGQAPQVGTSEPEPEIIRQVQAAHARLARTRLTFAIGVLELMATVIMLVVIARVVVRERKQAAKSRRQAPGNGPTEQESRRSGKSSTALYALTGRKDPWRSDNSP